MDDVPEREFVLPGDDTADPLHDGEADDDEFENDDDADADEDEDDEEL